MDMREQVIKFEKFIQENDAKRARAEAKAKQVREQCNIFGGYMSLCHGHTAYLVGILRENL